LIIFKNESENKVREVCQRINISLVLLLREIEEKFQSPELVVGWKEPVLSLPKGVRLRFSSIPVLLLYIKKCWSSISRPFLK
jgi:hypothetical protein